MWLMFEVCLFPRGNLYEFTFAWLIDIVNVSATDDMKTMTAELRQAKDEARLAMEDARLAKAEAAEMQGILWIF